MTDRKLWIIMAFVLVAAFSFRKRNSIQFRRPAGFPPPAYNFGRNPLSAEKIALGRQLFYDPILSRDSTISCSSCHLQYTAFTHVDHSLSHGIEGRIGNRNSPALMNLAWRTSFMWDGAINHLDVQALAPMANVAEMDETLAHVLEKMRAGTRYPALFRIAWGDSLITGERLLKSMSQFMLTLVSADSRYDKVKRGEDTFTAQEGRGYALFRNHCNTCHAEPLFTTGGFASNGLPPDDSLRDAGRGGITHQPQDSFLFRIPTLRNIELSSPYMHDGRFKTLQQVLGHYVSGIHALPNLSPLLVGGIHLTSNQRVDIVAFLLTLTDREFLYNPAYSSPLSH